MKILANPDLAKNLGDNAGVVYQNYYTEDRMLNEYAQLYILLYNGGFYDNRPALRSDFRKVAEEYFFMYETC